MCFVWIREQPAIISLYSISCLVSITETECVYCAVRTGYLYIIQVNFRSLSSPCHGSRGHLPNCHRGGLSSIPGQSMFDLWLTDRYKDGFFSPSITVFPCQYHSTIAPYSSIHLPPTLYNVFLPVLQFSPVSIIPPLPHTHPSIYHPHYIMFFSQYFSFPLSVSFHHCSILIHPSTTHAV